MKINSLINSLDQNHIEHANIAKHHKIDFPPAFHVAQEKEKDTSKILRSEQGFLIRQLMTKFNFQNFLDVTKTDKTLNHANTLLQIILLKNVTACSCLRPNLQKRNSEQIGPNFPAKVFTKKFSIPFFN